MFSDDTIAGSWTALAERVERGGALARWGVTESALAGLTRLEDVLALVRRGADRAGADEVIGALVRLAAVDGGADDDALLVVVHLLSPMVMALCRQLGNLAPDIVPVIVNQLVGLIRSYPWRRRTRAFGANLRADTRRAVLDDLLPRDRRHPGCCEEVLDPHSPAWEALCGGTSGPGEEADLDVVDLLLWAIGHGVDADDVALLLATERGRARCPGRSQDGRIAAEQGVGLRTLYQRRQRTLAALRDAAHDYLAAIA